jgi:myo-inositol catabolism protein IolC
MDDETAIADLSRRLSVLVDAWRDAKARVAANANVRENA